jgi:hypothetical protein
MIFKNIHSNHILKFTKAMACNTSLGTMFLKKWIFIFCMKSTYDTLGIKCSAYEYLGIKIYTSTKKQF